MYNVDINTNNLWTSKTPTTTIYNSNKQTFIHKLACFHMSCYVHLHLQMLDECDAMTDELSNT